MQKIQPYEPETFGAAAAVEEAPLYDVAVIGGGLAGLALSIQLAQQGHSVVLLEKETYPFHRVCGEYISLECWDFLERLGYPLAQKNLPIIKHLVVSAPGGSRIEHPLPLGGFGISRYKIDSELAVLARESGVQVREAQTVRDVQAHDRYSTVVCSGGQYRAKLVCGTWGKRSNLDIRWKRPFVEQKPSKLNNYIGVKYHIRTDAPAGTIALHNFRNGYCGLSRIEEGKYCLCYLTTADNLRQSGNSISRMEEQILYRNPFLRQLFREAEFLYKSPLTISQVSFASKSQTENHVLLTGDATGMITPLCGNGMSMALHGSQIAARLISRFLSGQLSGSELEERYTRAWKQQFSGRLQAGRLIQRLFGNEWMTDAFIRAMKPFPGFVSLLIRQTHGKAF